MDLRHYANKKKLKRKEREKLQRYRERLRKHKRGLLIKIAEVDGYLQKPEDENGLTA